MAKRKSRNPKRSGIPSKQWDMPATYRADSSRMATFRELIDPTVPTLSLSQLDRDKLADLVAKRIELQPKYEMMMVGAGPIDRDRAITEVKAQTDVGRILMEIEQRAIQMLADRATQLAGVKTRAKTRRKATKHLDRVGGTRHKKTARPKKKHS
jgi:hypothetical protein